MTITSPRILRPLESISYLGKQPADGSLAAAQPAKPKSSSAERVGTRLLETVSFFLDVMGCSDEVRDSEDIGRKLADLLPGGGGWSAILRIRLLHAITRKRVARQYRRKPQPYPGTSAEDAPISQEDVGIT